MTLTAPQLVCAGCAHVMDATDPLPFRCPRAAAGDDIDHVLARPLPSSDSVGDQRWPSGGETNPFIRYRTLLYSWQLARAHGLSDRQYTDLVNDIDARIAEVDGRGFIVTPCVSSSVLATALGLSAGEVLIKDETHNVAGSHKARHLMGLAIYLAVAERAGLSSETDKERALAIASCGNAALAAAVVARAAGRALRVFVPTWADPQVVDSIRSLGAEIAVCERKSGDPPGDPCVLAFREAVANGALPFTCQGNESGLTIDGGMTLAFELVDQLGGTSLDRLFVQVGGGALASACAQGLSYARALGALRGMPVLHAVQSEAVQPLARAFRRVVDHARGQKASADPSLDDARDEWQRRPENAQKLAEVLSRAARRRSEYMWPVENPGHSVADGILDDETYDWLAVTRAMIATHGSPVVAREALIEEACLLARTNTGISVSATGSSGLAGALSLSRAHKLRPDERVAVLFTGVSR